MFDDSDPYWAARMRMTPDEMEALKRKAAQQTRDAYDATTRAMAEAGDAAKGWWREAENAGDRFRTGFDARMRGFLGGPQPAQPEPELRGPIYPPLSRTRPVPVSDRWQEPAAPLAGPEACVVGWPLDPQFSELNRPRKLRTGEKQGDGRYGDGVSGIVRHRVDGAPREHLGIDISAPIGSPIYARRSGVVVRQDAANVGGYGRQIVIDYGGGLATRDAHLSDASVKKGDHVRPGQVIGLTGVSGNPVVGGDPHLHHEVLIGGRAVPPNAYQCPPGVVPRFRR